VPKSFGSGLVFLLVSLDVEICTVIGNQVSATSSLKLTLTKKRWDKGVWRAGERREGAPESDDVRDLGKVFGPRDPSPLQVDP
jgi:hypothetical protein